MDSEQFNKVLLNATHAFLLCENEKVLAQYKELVLADNYVFIFLVVDGKSTHCVIDIGTFVRIFNSLVEINNKYYFYSAELNTKIITNVNSKLAQKYYFNGEHIQALIKIN
jgi:hypothetical protein